MSIRDDHILQLIDICHRLYAKGFVAATDGNVSVRIENGNVLTTRTSVNKGMVTSEDLVEADMSGNPVPAQGKSTAVRPPPRSGCISSSIRVVLMCARSSTPIPPMRPDSRRQVSRLIAALPGGHRRTRRHPPCTLCNPING
jgi:hypothetical protein